MRVMGSEGSRPPRHVVLADARPEVEQDAEREGARDAVDDEGRDRVVEAEPGREPAARAPAPGGVHDPDAGAEEDGEKQVGGEPDALDEGARHDRAGRPREEEKGEEEDGADVIAEVRAHLVGPRRRRAAEARKLGIRPGVTLSGTAVLEAAVDVP